MIKNLIFESSNKVNDCMTFSTRLHKIKNSNNLNLLIDVNSSETIITNENFTSHEGDVDFYKEEYQSNKYIEEDNFENFGKTNEINLFDQPSNSYYLDSSKINQEIYIYKTLLIIKTISSNYTLQHQIRRKKIFLPPSKFNTTLLIDLDETLVYTDFAQKYKKHDYVYEGVYHDVNLKVGINFRPGLMKFLNFISQNFEVVLYTSAMKTYADIVLKIIDPEDKYFSYKLYREQCIDINNGFIIKNLKIIANRSKDKLFIIDNNLLNFYSNLCNGYLIPSFYNNPFDDELMILQDFLKKTDLKRELILKFQFQDRIDNTL